jgi:hypothetical protein
MMQTYDARLTEQELIYIDSTINFLNDMKAGNCNTVRENLEAFNTINSVLHIIHKNINNGSYQQVMTLGLLNCVFFVCHM